MDSSGLGETTRKRSSESSVLGTGLLAKPKRSKGRAIITIVLVDGPLSILGALHLPWWLTGMASIALAIALVLVLHWAEDKFHALYPARLEALSAEVGSLRLENARLRDDISTLQATKRPHRLLSKLDPSEIAALREVIEIGHKDAVDFEDLALEGIRAKTTFLDLAPKYNTQTRYLLSPAWTESLRAWAEQGMQVGVDVPSPVMRYRPVGNDPTTPLPFWILELQHVVITNYSTTSPVSLDFELEVPLRTNPRLQPSLTLLERAAPPMFVPDIPGIIRLRAPYNLPPQQSVAGRIVFVLVTAGADWLDGAVDHNTAILTVKDYLSQEVVRKGFSPPASAIPGAKLSVSDTGGLAEPTS